MALLAACGGTGGRSTGDGSGVTGWVRLGPQCPVETQEEPCPEKPATGVTVTVAEQLPGESYAAGAVVAKAVTDADGSYRVAVAPGSYVVTAQAGMSCELMDVVVVAGAFARVDVPCDTGIR